MPESRDPLTRDNVICLPFGTTRAPAPPPAGFRRPAMVEEPEEDGEVSAPPPHEIEPAVEALLLSADRPVTVHELDEWLAGPGADRIECALRTIQARLERRGGGIRLHQVAKGWQLRTDIRFRRWVLRMRGGKAVRLSRAALEVLAIVAYRQPITRAEIEELRGVDSGGVLRMLCERGLIEVVGRKVEPGRPLLYGTTRQFMSLFGLRDLSALPTLRDLRELEQDDPREWFGREDDTL